MNKEKPYSDYSESELSSSPSCYNKSSQNLLSEEFHTFPSPSLSPSAWDHLWNTWTPAAGETKTFTFYWINIVAFRKITSHQIKHGAYLDLWRLKCLFFIVKHLKSSIFSCFLYILFKFYCSFLHISCFKVTENYVWKKSVVFFYCLFPHTCISLLSTALLFPSTQALFTWWCVQDNPSLKSFKNLISYLSNNRSSKAGGEVTVWGRK